MERGSDLKFINSVNKWFLKMPSVMGNNFLVFKVLKDKLKEAHSYLYCRLYNLD